MRAWLKEVSDIRKSAKLLQDVHYITEDGVITPPKFINFEFITEKQAKKRGINPNDIEVKRVEKYGKILMTVTAYILIEDKETIVILDGSDNI